MKDWIDKIKNPKTDENEKYEIFYIKYYKPRIMRGVNPGVASNDAPENFSNWLKNNKLRVK